MEVSRNRGSPKSSVFMVFSTTNHPALGYLCLWTPHIWVIIPSPGPPAGMGIGMGMAPGPPGAPGPGFPTENDFISSEFQNITSTSLWLFGTLGDCFLIPLIMQVMLSNGFVPYPVEVEGGLTAETISLVYSGCSVKPQWVVCYERNRTVACWGYSEWVVDWSDTLLWLHSPLRGCLPTYLANHSSTFSTYLHMGKHAISKEVNNMDSTWFNHVRLNFLNHLILDHHDMFLQVFPCFFHVFRSTWSTWPGGGLIAPPPPAPPGRPGPPGPPAPGLGGGSCHLKVGRVPQLRFFHGFSGGFQADVFFLDMGWSSWKWAELMV